MKADARIAVRRDAERQRDAAAVGSMLLAEVDFARARHLRAAATPVPAGAEAAGQTESESSGTRSNGTPGALHTSANVTLSGA